MRMRSCELSSERHSPSCAHVSATQSVSASAKRKPRARCASLHASELEQRPARFERGMLRLPKPRLQWHALKLRRRAKRAELELARKLSQALLELGPRSTLRSDTRRRSVVLRARLVRTKPTFGEPLASARTSRTTTFATIFLPSSKPPGQRERAAPSPPTGQPGRRCFSTGHTTILPTSSATRCKTLTGRWPSS